MKKYFGIILTAMMVITLTACGSGEKKTASSESAKTETNQLEAIKKAGVLKVGTSADFAPFEFHKMVDGKDEIVGADVDMVNKIAEELGVKVEFMDMEFSAVLTALQQGKVDVAISGISATEERQQTFDFSMNYYNPPQKVMINKKNADLYTSIDSLKQKKVGAQKGSIQENVVKEQLGDAQIVSVAKVPNLVIELNQGSIDALVVEETIGAAYIAQNEDLMFADIDLVSNEDEAYAIALPKGSTELKTEIDKILEGLTKDGTIEEYVQKNIKLANESTDQ
ncbi:amino acid ABC transporter substrate-binding protein [Enterococcus sp. JM4C]|uniref:transporter substrate-binding domain-containing protein n=1 Tax=Candidatus Enterococcus huntleyi TaxID=1857217 RepID=UPI00137979C5|nr:transporter substrate-binding domain-containing protein [Enterococcus sp. JM4C]KAF1296822.1 amino acid ABC transporter substrate-binding protein [Enterococcus sp. JM4C]